MKENMLSAISGVTKVLDEELQTAMRLLGAKTIEDLGIQNVCPPNVTVEFRLKVHLTIRSIRELWSKRYTTDQLGLRN